MPISPARKTHHNRILLQAFIAGLIAVGKDPQPRNQPSLYMLRKNVSLPDWCILCALISILRVTMIQQKQAGIHAHLGCLSQNWPPSLRAGRHLVMANTVASHISSFFLFYEASREKLGRGIRDRSVTISVLGSTSRTQAFPVVGLPCHPQGSVS